MTVAEEFILRINGSVTSSSKAELLGEPLVLGVIKGPGPPGWGLLPPGPRAAEQLAEALDCYKADITAIQEIRWQGPGKRKLKTHDIYYGDCNRQQGTFGCGFVIGGRLRQNVLSFNCVNERLTTIRIKAKFTNISLICAHAPTEEKDDTTKANFYELLEKTYEQIPSYDIKIVLGDFNAKLGREDIFGSTVGKHSLHDNTSDNGFRLVDFAAGQNVVIASTRFPHLKIHKGTWKSPDQSTVNQIDHIAIDARHSSSIMDVRTFRGANIDSDHYLVVANVRMRISRPSPTQGNTVRKFNVGRLQSQEIARSYSDRVSNNLLRSPTPPAASIDNQWQHCQEAIRDAASEVLGFTRPPQRNPWFDDECRQAHAAKQKAYKAALHRRTRAANELYKRKRTEEHRLLRRKKRQHEKEAIVEIEGCYNRNEVRKFYQKVKRTSQGYRPRTEAYKDQQGNIVLETQAMLRIWKDHFCNLYNGDDEANPAQRQIAPFNIDDEGQHFRPPDLEEVKAVISKLKSNKAAGADGLAAELFKAAGDDLFWHPCKARPAVQDDDGECTLLRQSR
ncbi:uncharacterized protein LOC129919181 [Episyrphus balteatus]|uniref:uncharacterized protein LOC129919181 n=1 Tax=Episyrphus balteatus TaxID=286459 RepID=UPI00248575B3|nr:uncharacterized protein LOC129919181 [Episyrphus balteatus]